MADGLEVPDWGSSEEGEAHPDGSDHQATSRGRTQSRAHKGSDEAPPPKGKNKGSETRAAPTIRVVPTRASPRAAAPKEALHQAAWTVIGTLAAHRSLPHSTTLPPLFCLGLFGLGLG